MKKILMLGLIDSKKNDASKIHFFELANSFILTGNKVDLLIPGDGIDRNLCDASKIFHLPFLYQENITRVFLLSIIQIIYYIFISSNSYDFIYIRIRLFPCFFLKIINRIKGLKTKIFTEQAGWLETEMKIQKHNKTEQQIAKWIQLIDAKFADKVIVMTEGIKERLIKNHIHQNKIYVVENGTNLSHFFPLNQNNRIKLKRELLNSENIILGFIGNISKWQGIENLIRVFKKIRKKHNNLSLLLIGSGLYLDEIKKLITKENLKDFIILKENIPYKEVNLWMNIIDIAFAPKIKELDGITSPLKLRDYAASGNAVISTRIRGIKEFEQFGWLETFDPEVDGELEQKIDFLVSNPEKIVKMTKMSRDYAENNFSWNRVAKKIVEIFDKKK